MRLSNAVYISTANIVMQCTFQQQIAREWWYLLVSSLLWCISMGNWLDCWIIVIGYCWEWQFDASKDIFRRDDVARGREVVF